MFSELYARSFKEDVKRIVDGDDGDRNKEWNNIMAIQGTWKHKGSLEDNYKITGMILY